MESPYLNKYEMATILGRRALQIAMGAPPLVDIDDEDVEPLQIAQKELDQNKLPIVIKRSEFGKEKNIDVRNQIIDI